MKHRDIEFCKKGISIVTENANGEAYTIIARHIADIVRDWTGSCKFVPANDARVHFVVMGGIIKEIPENYTFEVLVKELMEKLAQ